MGFLWSKPLDQSPLCESLLDEEPELIFRTADLLIARSSELEITLSADVWAHVGVCVIYNNQLCIFCDGEFVRLRDWLDRYQSIVVRHCHAVRTTDFDSRVLDACNRVFDLLLRNEIDIDYREGYCASMVLGIMGLIDLAELSRGKFTAVHFSSDSPFNRLHLNEYSNNWSI